MVTYILFGGESTKLIFVLWDCIFFILLFCVSFHIMAVHRACEWSVVGSGVGSGVVIFPSELRAPF